MYREYLMWLEQWWQFWGYLSGFIRLNAFRSNPNANITCEGAMWNMCNKHLSEIRKKWGIYKSNTFLLLKKETYRKGYVGPYIFTV